MIKEKNVLVPGLVPTLKKVVYIYEYKNKQNRDWRTYRFEFSPEELTPDITVGNLKERLYWKYECTEVRWYETVRDMYITCSECGHEVLTEKYGRAQCEKCKTNFEELDCKFYPTTVRRKYEKEIKKLLLEDEEFLQNIDFDDDDYSVTCSVSTDRYKDKWAICVWIVKEYDDPEDEAYSYIHRDVYWIGDKEPHRWLGECVSTLPTMDRYIKYVNSLNDVKEI